MTIEEDDANLHVENNCINQRFGTRNKAKSDARAENLGQRIKPDNTTLGVQGEEAWRSVVLLFKLKIIVRVVFQ